LDHFYSLSGVGNIRCNSSDSSNLNHQWKLESQGDNYYRIINRASGYAIADQ
jgi:hypothetical protein